jgi:hypothetical protein
MLYTKLESHFQNLDECELKGSKIFNTQADKERYESYIMFAFRKFQSLKYHLENTKRLLKKEAEILAKKSVALPEVKGVRSTSFTMKQSKDAHELIYELSAFLAALKSCLDLLAEVMSYYLKGIDVNYSITPLLKLMKKRKSKILMFIEKNENWIKDIRDYRHPIIHRLVLHSKSGHEIHQRNGKTTKVLYPVLIPKNTPKFVADTRRQRMMNSNENSLHNSVYSEQTCTVTNNGVEELINFKINIEPSSGYVRIEDFIETNKKVCEKYLIDLIEILNNLNFEYDRVT